MPRKKGGGGETLWCLPAKVERFSCVSWRRSLRSLKRNSQVKSVTTTRCHNLARSKRFELIRWGLLRLTNMSETVTAPRLTQTWRRGRLGCSVSQVPPLFFPPLSHPPLPSISSHFTPHSTGHERHDFFFSSTPQEQPQKPDAAQSTSARHVCVCIGERSPPFSSRHPQTDRITKRKHQHVVRFCPVSRTRWSWHRGLGKLGSPNK